MTDLTSQNSRSVTETPADEPGWKSRVSEIDDAASAFWDTILVLSDLLEQLGMETGVPGSVQEAAASAAWAVEGADAINRQLWDLQIAARAGASD